MLPLQTPPDTHPPWYIFHTHAESIFQGKCQYFRLMLTETLLGASNCQCYLLRIRIRYVYAAYAAAGGSQAACVCSCHLYSLKSRSLTLNCSKAKSERSSDRQRPKLMSWKSNWTNLCDLLSNLLSKLFEIEKENSGKAAKWSDRKLAQFPGGVTFQVWLPPKGYDPFAMQMLKKEGENTHKTVSTCSASKLHTRKNRLYLK